MTVKELIKKLEKVKDQNMDVIVQGIDPTDYIYYNDVDGVGVEKVYLSEYDNKKTKVFIIDGGMF
jgi:hypothetical protein